MQYANFRDTAFRGCGLHWVNFELYWAKLKYLDAWTHVVELCENRSGVWDLAIRDLESKYRVSWLYWVHVFTKPTSVSLHNIVVRLPIVCWRNCENVVHPVHSYFSTSSIIRAVEYFSPSLTSKLCEGFYYCYLWK